MHLCLMFTRFFRINSRRFPIVKHLMYGGPNGEMGAALRYLSQRYSMPDEVTKSLLTDIGTEEYVPRGYPFIFTYSSSSTAL